MSRKIKREKEQSESESENESSQEEESPKPKSNKKAQILPVKMPTKKAPPKKSAKDPELSLEDIGRDILRNARKIKRTEKCNHQQALAISTLFYKANNRKKK
jgi:hypothetical protein